MTSRTHHIPTAPLLLGLGGLIPFYVSAALIWFPAFFTHTLGDAPASFNSAWHLLGRQSLGIYGAVILSFLGGIRWGNLLQDEQQINRWGPLCQSVVPSLVAWPALLLPTTWMLTVLSAGFAVQYAMDAKAVRHNILPLWFGRLRLILTTGAILALLTGLLGVVRAS